MEKVLKLSSQGRAAIVMVFQKGIFEQADMSEVMMGLQFAENEEGELVCLNPPTINFDKTKLESNVKSADSFLVADGD